MKDGVISLAQLTGAPVVPVGINMDWKTSIRSWDGFQLPLPFSRFSLHFGRPLYIASHADTSQREMGRQNLEDTLRLINAE